MNLENLNLVELNAQDCQGIDGGFLPIIVIGVCWGFMAVSSVVAVGIASSNNLEPAWK